MDINVNSKGSIEDAISLAEAVQLFQFIREWMTFQRRRQLHVAVQAAAVTVFALEMVKVLARIWLTQ